MIPWIYPEQLVTELKKELKSMYLLLGNDTYILRDSYLNIVEASKVLGFSRHIIVELNIYSCWNDIINLFKTADLFDKKKTLSLIFSRNYPISDFKKNASLLFSVIHDDIILILYINALNKIVSSHISSFLHYLPVPGRCVNCDALTDIRLITWVKNKAKTLQLIVEDSICQMLCYYYEGNLELLNQMLQNLSLIYSNKHLDCMIVKEFLSDLSCFSINHWIESILLGDKKRSDRILKRLSFIEGSLDRLFFKIIYEILVIVDIKNFMLKKGSLFDMPQKYKIHKKYRYALLFKAARRLNVSQLYEVVRFLAETELRYKKDYICLSQSIFEELSSMLC
ncbi:DNA polymerase III subunit delta [Candidatus Blochmannia ocreatus (nom. nud.)]|uniref:DNA polymerase III subunit delta n=1 Tax=Candidatus Blochmannia ocreatus (nom. nud.) TaxID=251538 RepID=A0ABY4STR6_9ENTR|nr:DNA polymerase III subunit delta [Candidatus Blochmannia ocreatus]URJ25371.1 DNA polymerase III subunit delta [Candidatus Blochmannia ocreatus]